MRVENSKEAQRLRRELEALKAGEEREAAVRAEQGQQQHAAAAARNKEEEESAARQKKSQEDSAAAAKVIYICICIYTYIHILSRKDTR